MVKSVITATRSRDPLWLSSEMDKVSGGLGAGWEFRVGGLGGPLGARRFTRGSRAPVVSLEALGRLSFHSRLPRRPSSHSWFPGARRLTRDSRIPAHFFVKKFRKNRKNHFFGLPGPKSSFEIFMIFYIPGNFYIKPHFRAPRPVLTRKSAF